MRFTRWRRVEPFIDTPRKRAAFERSQRAKHDRLPLFAELIGEKQHDVDTEMARRSRRWPQCQQDVRDRRAAKWRQARRRLYSFGDNMRVTLRALWRECPYPADPSYLLDLFHQIDVGRVDADRPPWRFHRAIHPKTTPSPATFNAAFKQIGAVNAGGGRNPVPSDRLTFVGNLGNGLIFLTSTVRLIEPDESSVGRSGHCVSIDASASCCDADLAVIQTLAQSASTRPVIVQRAKSPPPTSSEREKGKPDRRA